MQRPHPKPLAVEREQHAVEAVTQSDGVPHDRLEHGLRVRLRPADRAQDLARRRLLLEGFGQLAIPALELLEQPDVLDGDHGLVGEGLHQLDLLVGERPDLRPSDHENTDDRGFPQHGDGQDRPDLGASLGLGPAILGIGHGVVDVNDAALEEGPARRGLPAGAMRMPLHHLDEFRRFPVGDRRAVDVLVLPVDEALVGAAQPHRALHEALEDRLEIERRAADDLQDLARRRLLLERLGEVAVARFQLLEEPDVLDGDDGLVGERLQQLDLLVRERPRLGARDGDRPDGISFAHHRDRQVATIAEGSGESERRWANVGVVLEVAHLDDGAVQDGRCDLRLPTRRPRVGAAKRLEPLVCKVVVSDEVDQLTVEAKHAAEEAVAELDDARSDRVEHGLDIGGRARDDPQDLAGRRLLLEGFG